ncbi:sugar phosphate isomerase/epimerase family protein [Alienimonas chondri]|uniref:Xylose isomerase-like TIM barrel domain-containing protein n=1 Tax=Alienimonas chondri TaxID=2681879 RepID=A0ABX1VE71_9PLAN|nr:TIM barrel protein [Alienimonas chondri]NNJ26398.1 hypothetical protein [Alienimonas chondri]
MRRRDFLTSTAAATAALSAGAGIAAPVAVATPRNRASRPPVAIFTKSFQEWPIDRVALEFAGVGVHGLDLTVRPGGHIEPEQAAAKLPAAVEDAAHEGQRVLMLTTGITDAGPASDRLMAVAAENGVTELKLGYFRQNGVPLAKRMDEVRRTLAEISVLAEKRGVTACMHVHSGEYLPSHGTMLHTLLKDLPPAHLGAYVDTLHMHLEGGDAGWRQGLELLAPWIKLCAVKNYRKESNGRDDFGMAQFKEVTTPVAEGFSPIPDFVKELKRRGFNGVFSLHSEYRGSHSWKPLDTAETLEQTREDWAFFENVLDEVY